MGNLKFRAWDKFNENMTHSELTTLSKFFKNIERLRAGGNDIVIIQYTGLKDKNGKEIYEGDVLERDDGKIIIVEFGEQDHQENYGDIFRYVGFNLCLAYGYAELYKYEHEIIGNIYENPELLEKN